MTPEQEAQLLETVAQHDKQISYWRGAIAVIAFVIIVFGAVFAEHLLKGGSK